MSDRLAAVLAALREKGSDDRLWSWGQPPGDSWWHCTVQLKGSDVVIDWTSRQFDSDAPCPRIEPRVVAEPRWNLPGELDADSALVDGWPTYPPRLVRGRAAYSCPRERRRLPRGARHVRFRTIGCSKLGGTSTDAISRGVAPYRAGMSSKKVAPKVKLVAVIAPLATPLRPTPAK